MKAATYLILTAFLLPSVGCYDSGNLDDCLGYTCPGIGFDKPLGGEMNLEYIHQLDGTDLVRLSAHFLDYQDPEIPERLPFGCVDFLEVARAGGTIWPVNQGANREYVDVGESITVRTGDFTYTAPRETATDDTGVEDFLFRFHDIVYKYRAPPALGMPDEFFDTRWSVDMTDAPPLKRGDWDAATYMPPRWQLTSPEGFVHQVNSGEPYTLKWEMLTPIPDEELTAVLAVFATLENGQIVGINGCFGNNTGEITVPGDVITALPGDRGVLQMGVVTDNPVLTEEGRIIHIMSQNCYQFSFERDGG